ncbi:MAG: cytochrome b/b6 domain-containing protein [Thiotrichales bacterium]
MSKVLLFTRFERFWHWVQAILIFGLLFTGFGIHGVHGLMNFELAVDVHIILAWSLIGLWAFAIFWHLTTGEWKQYVPTGKGLFAMILYYAYGIFSGEAKPYHKTRSAKHNPLQRLAYLGFKVVIAPALWISGLLYLFYASWSLTPLGGMISLTWIAWVHTAAAFALMVFLVAHLYLAMTMGHPWYALLTSMITGYEDLEERKKA